MGGTPACASCPLQPTCDFQVLSAEPGQRLIGQGEPVDRFFLIRSGRLSIARLARDGAERMFSLRREGECVGFEGCEPARRSAREVRVHAAGELCVISAERLRELMHEEPRLLRFVLQRALEALDLREHELEICSLPVRERVVTFLLDPQARARCAPMSGRTLARVLGIRPETLSRTLAVLRRQKLVSADPSLQVLQPDALAALLA